MTANLSLTRLLDQYDTEWLIVADMAGEIMRLKWTEDLKNWMNNSDVQEQIEKGDPTPLLEYRRMLKV
jgi:hypothetical protein